MSLDHALSYQRRGWVPVPTFEVRTRQGHLVCSCPAGPDCPSPAKHPRVAWRHLDRLDPAQVQAWWRRWPSAGIALRTGQVSGLVVVDVDPGHGGSASLDALTEGYGPLPPTLSVSTGGGGWHHYFAAPGLALPNDAGRVLGAGLDVRAEGGIVVAPPTRHLSGQRYAWATTGPPDPTPLPTWIAERLSRPPPRLASLPVPAVEPVPARAAPYGRAALAGECQAVRAAGEGTRNATLNRAAFRLGQLAGGGVLAPEEVAARLLVAGVAAGLSESEARATAASGLRAGLGSPRGVPARGHPGHEVHRRSRELSRRALSPDRGRELDR